MKKALTTKLGPLPRWAWAVIILVGLLLYLRYRANQNSPNSNPSDPYSSYNTGQSLSQYPADTPAAYPLSGGGSGFDPTSFQQGLQYGAGLGGAASGTLGTGAATDNSVPDNSGGNTLPPAQGNITINVPGANGGLKGTTKKSTPTSKAPINHPATQAHTSTGGGPPHRSSTSHITKPKPVGARYTPGPPIPAPKPPKPPKTPPKPPKKPPRKGR